MITEPGRKILKEEGLQPVKPAVVTKNDDPERGAKHAEKKASLGPLKL